MFKVVRLEDTLTAFNALFVLRDVHPVPMARIVFLVLKDSLCRELPAKLIVTYLTTLKTEFVVPVTLLVYLVLVHSSVNVLDVMMDIF